MLKNGTIFSDPPPAWRVLACIKKEPHFGRLPSYSARLFRAPEYAWWHAPDLFSRLDSPFARSEYAGRPDRGPEPGDGYVEISPAGAIAGFKSLFGAPKSSKCNT